ncbi:hypothetical protein BH11PSE9_BH11PSE9_22450 [soil metagenome]
MAAHAPMVIRVAAANTANIPFDVFISVSSFDGEKEMSGRDAFDVSSEPCNRVWEEAPVRPSRSPTAHRSAIVK